MFSDSNAITNLIRNSDWPLIDSMRKFIIDKIGSRETNMMKLINILEKK